MVYFLEHMKALKKQGRSFVKSQFFAKFLPVAVLILVLGLVGASAYWYEHNRLGKAVEVVVLTLTLVAVAFYVYLTYILALASWIPVGTFHMKQVEKDPYHILTFPGNPTKQQNIKMWVKLNATIYGQPVELGGFYSAESPWYLQPLSQGQGHFRIETLLEKVGQTIAAMENSATPTNVREQLRFSVNIRFEGVESQIQREYPVQNYYFDFSAKVLVLDV